jgi:hypothetical protein
MNWTAKRAINTAGDDLGEMFPPAVVGKVRKVDD